MYSQLSNIDRQPIKMIKASEIKKYFTMNEAIESMDEAFKNLSSGKTIVPQRYVTSINENALTLLMKPVADERLNRSAIKILTQKNKAKVRGIPTIIGIVLVIDSQTGEILSIMDGEYLTSLRTGAASGLATKYFSSQKAKTLAVFGCGAQGKTQLEAVLNIRDISKIWVFDKNVEMIKSFIAEMQPKIEVKIEAGESLEVLKECDIICTATNSETPLFELKHLKKGVHINAVGSFKPTMQEIDPLILQNALIFVDQKKTCLAESGDLIKPIKSKLFNEYHIKGEIGEYILGRIKGRENADDITVFKSVGVAIQDFTVANKIYDKSKSYNFGQDINIFS